MKKKISLIIFSVITFFLLFGFNVYGYELKFQTDYDSEKDVYYFYTHVKSSQHSREYFKTYKKSDGTSPQYNKDFIQVDLSDTVNGVYYGSYGNRWGSYDILGIMFHSEPLSNYDSSTLNSPIEYFYAYTDSDGKPIPGTESVMYSSWSTGSNFNVANVDQGEVYKDNPGQAGTKYKITSKSSNDFQRYAIGTQEFPYPEYTLSDSSNASTIIYRYAVPAEVFKRPEVEKYKKVDENGNTYIYISFETKYAGTSQNMQKAGDFYEKVFGNSSNTTDRAVKFRDWIKTKAVIEAYTKRKEYMQEHREEIEGQSGDRYTQEYNWLTTQIEIEQGRIDSIQNNYHFVQDTESSDVFGPFVKGVTYSNTYALGYSAANDYDNRLYLSEFEESSLYVQYQLFDIDAKSEEDGIFINPEELYSESYQMDAIKPNDPTNVYKNSNENLTKLDRSFLNLGDYTFEKYSLENNSSYYILSARDSKNSNLSSIQSSKLVDYGLIYYGGKAYILVDCMQETEYFDEALTTKIQKFAYSKFYSSNGSFETVYNKLNSSSAKKVKESTNNYDIQSLNSGSNTNTIIRKVYIEVPLNLYVQYQLVTLSQGEYVKDYVDLFKEEIELKNNSSRTLIGSKSGIANSVLKLEKLDKSDNVVGKELEGKHIEDAIKYKDEIEKSVYENFSLELGSKYKYSAKNTFTLREGEKTVKFYLAEYLAKVIDDPSSADYIVDSDIREKLREIIYSLEQYKTKPTISDKYSSVITPKDISFKSFLDAYKSIIREGKNENSFATFIFNPAEYYETEESKKSNYAKFDGGPYYYPANELLRLTYIEVPVRTAEVYVKYELMTYNKESKEMDSSFVDLYGNNIKTQDGREFQFTYVEDPTAESRKIVIGQIIHSDYTLDVEGDEVAHRTVLPQNQNLEPLYLPDVNTDGMYNEQISNAVYEKFDVPMDEKIYRFSSQIGFGLNEKGLDNVTFYLIDFLAECYQNGTISEYITDKEDPDGKIREYVAAYITSKRSKYALGANFKEANQIIESSSKGISKFYDGTGETRVTRYGYSEGISDKVIIGDDITSYSVETLLKTGTVHRTQLLKLVYVEVPYIGETIDTIQLEGLNIEGKLQFISIGNKQDFTIDDKDKISNYENNDSYPFFNTTVSENSGDYDFIPTNEFITPYATNVYSYIIRAMGWKAHDDDIRFSNTIEVKRSYEYTLRWVKDNSGLPTDSKYLIKNGVVGKSYIDYVKGNKNLFYYESEKSNGKSKTENLSYSMINLSSIDLNSTILQVQQAYQAGLEEAKKLRPAEAEVKREETENTYNEQLKNEIEIDSASYTYGDIINLLDGVSNEVIAEINSRINSNEVFKYQYDSLFDRYKTDKETYYTSDDYSYRLNDSDTDNKEYINKQLILQMIYNYIYNKDITVLADKARADYFKNQTIDKILLLKKVSETQYSDGYGHLYEDSLKRAYPGIIDGHMSEYQILDSYIYIPGDSGTYNNWSIAAQIITEEQLESSGALNWTYYRYIDKSILNGWDAIYYQGWTYNGPYYSVIDNSLLFPTILNNNAYLKNTLTNIIKDILSDGQMEASHESYNFEKDNDYFIKYWFYDTSVCPYAQDEKHAYGDHEHNASCCRGFAMDTTSPYKYNVKFKCNQIVSYEFKMEITIIKGNGESTTSPYGRVWSGNYNSYKSYEDGRERFLAQMAADKAEYEQTLAQEENNNTTIRKVHGTNPVYTYCKTTYNIKENGTTSDKNYNARNFKFEYNDSSKVYHSTAEVKSGKCAENVQEYNEETGSYGEVSWDGSYVPGTFKNGEKKQRVAGSIRQVGEYKCPNCGAIYHNMIFGCTFYDIQKLLPLESSDPVKKTGNVNNCKNGYPYYKLPSCKSAFSDECVGLKENGNNAHEYKSDTHNNLNSRCFAGHVHNANCYRTNQLDLTKLNDIASGEAKENEVLKNDTIANSKDWDYKYWISPEGKDSVNELIMFTDGGFTFKDIDKTYQYNYQVPKVTGIDCSDELISKEAKSVRRYAGSLHAKYFSITNFQLYRVASLTLHSNDESRDGIVKDVTDENGNTEKKEVAFAESLLGNPTFSFKDSNKTTLVPNDEYIDMFNTKENSLHAPKREVPKPVIGMGDTLNGGLLNSSKVLNLDLYADNFMSDSKDYVISKYDDESFKQGRTNYLVSRASSKKDFNMYSLGAPVTYTNELNYTKSLLQSGYDRSIINTNAKVKIATITSTKNNTNYSFGNYLNNVILIEAKLGEDIKYVPTTKEKICEYFLKMNNSDYTLQYVGDNRVYRIVNRNTGSVVIDNYQKLQNELEDLSGINSFVTIPGKYTGAGGQNSSAQRGDTFTGYRKDVGESQNMFLADSELSSTNLGVAKLFEKKAQESVEAMSNTEAALRVGISYEVKDYYNDYFTFTKAYGETLYSDPQSSSYKAGALDHHTRYTTNETTTDSLLNKNNAWGYVKYIYDYIDGMRVFVAHTEESYNSLINNYNSVKKSNNLDQDNYFLSWYKDENEGRKFKKANYTNTVKTTEELINSHAFEDNLEYNLQQRKDKNNINLNSVQYYYKDTSWQLIQQLTAFGVRFANGETIKIRVNPNNELNKLFDLTDFTNVGTEFDSKQNTKNRIKEIGDSIRFANGNNFNTRSLINEVGGSAKYSYLGLDGTYYKSNYKSTYEANSNSSEAIQKLSEYTYTKNYDLYTDRASNIRKLDIYDWKLSSYETIASLTKDIKNGQKVGDGTGNGVRDFAFDVTYILVDDSATDVYNYKKGEGLYRFNYGVGEGELKRSNNTPVADYTNYTEYGKITRTGADQVYMAEVNFKGSDKYQKLITNDDTFTTGNKDNTGSKINILNPVKIADADIRTIDLISQEVTTRNDGKIKIIGKNTQFEVIFKPESSTAHVNYNNGKGVPTGKYIKEYWIKCDFDLFCDGCIVHGNSSGFHSPEDSQNGIVRVACNLDGETVFKGTTTATYGGKAIGVGERSIVVYAIASDTPEKVILETLSSSNYIDEEEVTYEGRQTGNMNQNLLYQKTINDAYHIANKTFKTESTYRIFSFEITDFKDLSYKNVFKNGISSTGNYFAGKYQWDYTILDDNNELINMSDRDYNLSTSNARIDRQIPTNYNKYGGGYILPVGPNSISKTGYVYGPKLGYTFSFDFVTTGYFNNVGNSISNRKTTIKPSYYYLSKDGEIIDNVELYYKNADGKYVRFIGSGYKIAFKPNDGYRNLRFAKLKDYHGGDLSSNLEYIDISDPNGFTLDNKFMTTSFDGFMQTWYGEFKLPNSTIVVKSGNSPNEALKDGYIGVCFEIKCEDKDYVQNGKPLVVSYNVNDAGDITKAENAVSKTALTQNTSQWDYDGMFGKITVGKTEDENGYFNIEGILPNNKVWKVSNKDWQKVKSTVVLYETDLRADDDFN